MQVDVQGTRLWFVPDGPAMRQRPTVVLLHGGPGASTTPTSSPTSRGSPRSPRWSTWTCPAMAARPGGDPARWSIERCADHVRGFCDALGIARPVLYGHSLGGLRRHGPCGAPPRPRQGAGAPVHPCPLRPGPDRGGVPPGRGRRGRRDRRAGLRRRQPVGDRRGVGALDPVTPVAAAREILDALPRGRARLAVIEGAGHFTWRDAPDRHWPLVTGFVAATAHAGAGV